MFLHDNIADIEETDGICPPTFTVDEFLGLFLHPSFYISLFHSTFKISINNKWCLTGFLALNKS